MQSLAASKNLIPSFTLAPSLSKLMNLQRSIIGGLSSSNKINRMSTLALGLNHMKHIIACTTMKEKKLFKTDLALKYI